jgi:sugar O-acyltransferase (sialic acid O-acetyltransferase NeuD family)
MSEDFVNTQQELLIYGCGGHSKSTTEVVRSLGFTKVKYIEDRFTVPKKEFLGNPVMHEMPIGYGGQFFIAIGDNSAREKVYKNFQNQNPEAKSISLVHPSSFVASTAQIDKGVVVPAFGYVGADSRIGKGAIVYTSVVGHENVLGEFCSISAGVSIGGGTSVGRRTAILIGASIMNNISIGDDCVIGGSSFVRTDVPNNSVFYGVPAKFVRKRESDESYMG